jgi:hypothetical protein
MNVAKCDPAGSPICSLAGLITSIGILGVPGAFQGRQRPYVGSRLSLNQNVREPNQAPKNDIGKKSPTP